MSPEPGRRYSEEEVAEIFERATDPRTRRAGSGSGGAGEGLTLAELREIGREVGVSPERVEEAARSLDRPAAEIARQADVRRVLGIRVGVGRIFPLPRPLTDDEWHGVVADARRTFDATGKVEEQGRYREWRNSNLRVIVEPDGRGGEQLRLRTVKGSARSGIGVGAALVGASALLSVLGIFTGGEGGAMPEDLLPLFMVGAVFLGINLFTLPGWASTRERQMEGIGHRLLGSMGSPRDPAATDG